MNRMRLVAVLLVIIAGVFVAYALANAQSVTGPITVTLEPNNHSGQTGTATLTDVGGKTKVEIVVNGEPPEASQPAQIHQGQCGPTLARLVHPLANVEGGKSTTTIDVPLSALMTGGFAINGHASEEEYNIYVFCGNIPSVAILTAQGTSTGAAIAEAAVTPSDSNSLTVGLQAESKSGQTGTATLIDLGNGRTRIEIDVAGQPAGSSELMHLHAGQCGPTLARLIFQLENLEDGKSVTTIDAPLSSLTTGGFAINGHKSKEEYSTYVLCGNIPAVGAGGVIATPVAAAVATLVPTEVPATVPPATATEAATLAPVATLAPTEAPTATSVPTQAPTSAPTATSAPTQAPTSAPTATTAPTEVPTTAPTATSVTPATTAPTATSAPTKAAPTTAAGAATSTTAATEAATMAATTQATSAATTAATIAPTTAAGQATSAATKAASSAATEAATTAPTEAATQAATEQTTAAATQAAATETATTAAATETSVATETATAEPSKTATAAATEATAGPTPATVPDSGGDPQTERFLIYAVLGVLVLGTGLTLFRFSQQR